ncbi:MAG TPA: 50S ribosomal protein L3 [Thermodesulfobacteriota bacterium]|nr:50S ribosomal protein L3 [Thermodesulfobacteriota bacterium]
MIEGILGKKLGMTEFFLENGTSVPATVIEAGPCFVVQKRTAEKDGYEALQIGFGEMKPQRVSKPMLGHFKKAGVSPLRHIVEFSAKTGDYKPGDEIRADVFKEGETVDVVGTSKGKGFAGAMKRHHFAGQPASHGGMAHRRPGGIGSNTYPARVWKGIRMPGHMGAERVTHQGAQIFRVDAEKNIIIIKGSVPGPRGGLVIVKRTSKGSRESAAA